MTIILIGMLLALSAAFVLLLVHQLRSRRDTLLNQQLIDLRNQLVEMRTHQLQAQGEGAARQNELFNDTQKIISGQLGSILQSVNENLTKTQSNIITQLNSTGTVVHDIQRKLGALEETTRQIREIGKDISSLQDILQAPKLRGNLGEYLLEDLIRQVFPAKNFTIKHSFRSGVQVDAVIRLGEKLIPIDAKFPLESFQRLIGASTDEEKKTFRREFVRSVKDRIDEIAGKYIRPEEGTFDFALMYIPAENVFYEAVINDTLTGKDHEIFNYALQRHVIPVSPNSFYAYLMAIVYGLKGFHIEQQTKVIITELTAIQDRFGRFYGDFQLVGKHLGNAVSKFEECSKKAEKVDDKLSEIAGLKGEFGAKRTGELTSAEGPERT